MTKRMLIDASHTEETRVVVLDGNRLEDFDLEAANRLPLKGNIYLAKVVRVEPSLQAAFVEYGGNRHGFLPLAEIHPDYYQIPIADRQRLLAMQAAEAREEEAAEEEEAKAAEADAGRFRCRPGQPARTPPRPAMRAGTSPSPRRRTSPPTTRRNRCSSRRRRRRRSRAWRKPGRRRRRRSRNRRRVASGELLAGEMPHDPATTPAPEAAAALGPMEVRTAEPEAAPEDEPTPEAKAAPENESAPATEAATIAEQSGPILLAGEGEQPSVEHAVAPNGRAEDAEGFEPDDAPPPEDIGGEAPEEVARERRGAARFMRQYKIQEVIKRRQIMLVQVVKEERGTKGAALTTYISLAGRFSVLMPNSPRGGGVSRKITSATDRRRLREVIDELELPDGMSLIVRTAGAQRPKPEIRRDCEYLLRLWDSIRERTLASSAPALIYEEADLIKRSIRDNYARDVEEILVDGEDAYQDAREFMRMLMPQHAQKVRSYRGRRALRPARGRGAARRHALARGAAPLRRLRRHQPDGGAGRHRRELRPLHARAAHRGHGAAHQPGGRGRDRAAAPPARPRRPDRHRLHRHGVRAATTAWWSAA